MRLKKAQRHSILIGFVLSLPFLLLACQQNGQKNPFKKQGAIVFGDSSTIVTVSDSQYLKDKVADIKPKEFLKSTLTRTKNSSSGGQDSFKSFNEIGKTSTGNFSIDFGRGVKVVFTHISTREFQKQNPQTDAGVSYAVDKGDLLKSVLNITGLKNVTVQQRYLSYLYLISDSSNLSLQNMGGFLGDWKELKNLPSSGHISISVNNILPLKFKSVSHNKIEKGVKQAARSSRLSRKKTNAWLHKIRHTRSAGDKPCKIKLDNVQWRISGTTKDGHHFFRTLRIDV